MIDLRSDTVTQPTEGMRKAMSEAIIGDDVLGDDPTVIELQNKAAKLLGKEAALYVPSGTMSNIVATRTHTSPGDEIVTEAHSHIYRYEGGAFAALSGCSVALVDGKNGLMTSEQVSRSIRKAEGSLSHYPNGSLVCVENTAQGGGGSVYSQEVIDAISLITGIDQLEPDPSLYAGGMSIGVGYTLQVVAQQHAKSSHAAIILGLEGAFAVLGGWLLLDEHLSTRGLIGCVLMLTGMLLSQLIPKFNLKKLS